MLSDWLPSRPWYPSGREQLASVGAYRFDDPAGDVGIETLLVRTSDGSVIQMPLTYRDAPLDGAEDGLIATMEHSVLGRRWVYDACSDPVYLAAIAAAIAGFRAQADELVEGADGPTAREQTARVTGSGDAVAIPAGLSVGDLAYADEGDVTVCRTPSAELRVRHLPVRADGAADGPCLTGTWRGQEDPVVLVTASRV